MKKIIPILIAIVLICVVVGVSFGKVIYDKYSYGQDRADLNEYFQIFNENDVPIILQDELLEEAGLLIDGTYYFRYNTVRDYFTDRFYFDSNEQLLLYTTATTTYETSIGSNVYSVNGESTTMDYPLTNMKNDELYIAIDYVKKYVNFSYELFTEPMRMQVYTEWNEREIADLKSDTQVRCLGGVKSKILTDVYASDTVVILEKMDTWTKVKTKDAYIGYVENKRLDNYRTEQMQPVTDVPEEIFPSLTHDYRINLTWHNMEYPIDGYDLQAAMANVKELNVVSPTWYWLSDNNGNILSVANKDYASRAHSMGLEVWALVANFHTGTDVDTYETLSYTSKRRNLTNQLITSALENGADGINLDFERVSFETADHYIQFVRELSVACHQNNLIFSVDNYVPTEYTAHYNREEQGKFADYIIIMGYDEHYKGSPEAGSVSSIDWMDAGIADTIAVVPKEKVINAVPFYTRVWKTSGGTVESEAVDMMIADSFISRNNISTKWDETTCQNYGEATLDKIFYQVWLEDAKSMGVRLNVMKKYDIAGVASWKLGQETPDIWDVIADYMNN